MTWTREDQHNWDQYFDQNFGPKLPPLVLRAKCEQCKSQLTWQKFVDPAGALSYKSWCCNRQYVYRKDKGIVTFNLQKVDNHG